MANHNIHITWDPKKETTVALAHLLLEKIGQTELHDADTVLSVGGDGALLYAMRRLQKGQQAFGIVPEKSTSVGFWTNRAGGSAVSVMDALDKATRHDVNPLKAVITHRSGKITLLRAFNEVAPAEYSGQAMSIEFTARLRDHDIGPIHIMGDGLVAATALGSTAMNHTYGGPAIDIRNTGIILTGKGIYRPKGGFDPIVAVDGTVFDIKFLEEEKRPTRVQYDGLSVNSDPKDPFVRIVIEKDHDCTVGLLLMDDPSSRAFHNMMP